MKTDQRIKRPSKEDYFRYAATLHVLSAGEGDCFEQTLVHQARSFKKPDEKPGRRSVYKDILYSRMIDLDADFFKKLVRAIERIKEGNPDATPLAAAVLRGYLNLLERTGKFPTANQLFDFLRVEEPECKSWRRVDEFGRSDPSLPHLRNMREIRKRFELHFEPDVRGRKPKFRKLREN